MQQKFNEIELIDKRERKRTCVYVLDANRNHCENKYQFIILNIFLFRLIVLCDLFNRFIQIELKMILLLISIGLMIAYNCNNNDEIVLSEKEII